MIDGIIRWSLHNPAVVVAMSLALMIWGYIETTRMAVDVFPDLTAPTVSVVTDSHGLSPEEMERQVTVPIEIAMTGATGVRRVRSNTAVGISIVKVEFDWGTDIMVARQIVGERLEIAKQELPPDIESPVLAPVSSIMGEIMFIAITSDERSPMDIRTLVDSQVRRRLMAVPGVAQIIPIGGERREFQVTLDPDRLVAYDIDANDVIEALGEANESTTAGIHEHGGKELLIEGRGRIYNKNHIEETVIVVRDDQPILVGMVGTAAIGPALVRGTGSAGGEPAVVVGIQKQPAANTLELTARIDAALDQIESGLPSDVEIDRGVFRQADFISVAVDNVALALRDGAILVVVIVLVFLGSGRATAITALAIPLSLLCSALILRELGGTINTMTLGGMAIAVGALVDDAIIDVENVVRRLRLERAKAEDDQRSLIAVVFSASREIRGSIVFATLIIMLVFLPLFFLPGVEGRLLEPLGLAYVVSLAASLVVALTITPVLCLLFLPTSRVVRKDHEPVVVRWLRQAYGWFMSRLMGHWILLTVPSVLILAGSLYYLEQTGRSFLPEFNEGALTVSIVNKPGTALARSDEVGRAVELALNEHPEVRSAARRTGRAELDEHAQGVHASEIELTLEMKDRSKEEMLASMRKSLAEAAPGASVTIGQPIAHRVDHMLSGTRASIAIKIYGPDLERLRVIAEEVENAAGHVEGVVDLNVQQQIEVPMITVRYKRPEMARYRLRVQDVSHALETAFAGTPVTSILDEFGTYDVVVRYDRELAHDLDEIRGLKIRTPTGAWVPLELVADVRHDRGPSSISREGGERLIVVSCNVAGRDVGGVVAEIRDHVEADVDMPPGYRVAYGGQFEAAETAAELIAWLGGGVLIGILLLLWVAFGSGRDALLVMMNLPFALIGGVAGVYLLGGVMSIAALIGFIALFGVATRNGIMMVTHIRHLIQDEGETDLFEAVHRAAQERLAPILMTAIASGLGLLPLALAAGDAGAEIQAPMAIVMLGGLVTSTLLNLILVPVLYLRFGACRAEVGA